MDSGIELRPTRHPETGSLLARLWSRLRCAAWPYDVSRASVETVEVDIPDTAAETKRLHILNRVSIR